MSFSVLEHLNDDRANNEVGKYLLALDESQLR